VLRVQVGEASNVADSDDLSLEIDMMRWLMAHGAPATIPYHHAGCMQAKFRWGKTMAMLPDGLPTDTSAFLAHIAATDDNVSQSELENICFIVTLINSLHASVYATFLSRSYAKELAAKLRVEALSVSFTLGGVQWKWRRRRGGAEETIAHHAIRADFDLKATHQLSRIGNMVLNGNIGAEDGLKAILAKRPDQQFEQLYRHPPGRPFAVALMSCGTCTICFGGTLIDGVFASLEGLLAGFLGMFCSEGFVAMAVSFYSILAVNNHPQETCCSSQVLGALFWFYFGTAFIIALFEVASGQLRIGILRLLFALIDSFRHAAGITVAIVVAAMLLGQDDVKDLVVRDCSDIEAHSGGTRLSLWGIQMHIPLFLILCVAVNAQLRVDIRDWPMCIAVQVITIAALYCCEKFKHGDFVSNFIPSFLAASSSLALLRLFGVSREQTISSTNNSMRNSSTDTLKSALRYDQRDAWFCIFPSLYLLIPGSGLVKACLFSIAGLFGFASDAIPANFAFVLLRIGLGQLLGIGLGMCLFEICCSRRRAHKGDTTLLSS